MHRPLSLPTFIPLALLLFAVPASAQEPGPLPRARPNGKESQQLEHLRIQIVPAHFSIHANDPLLTKVTITNASGEKLMFDRPFDQMLGTLVLEVRVKGRGEYEEAVNRRYGGLFAIEFPLIEVAQGESLASYAVTWRSEGEFIFSQPGTYQVRARIKSEGDSATSPPVEITVEAAPEGVERVNDETLDQLGTVLHFFSIPSRLTAADLDALEESVGDSVLKETANWIKAIRRHLEREKNVDQEVAVSMTHLLRIREQLDPMTAEVMDLVLVNELGEMDRWEAVAEVAARLDSSNWRVRVIQQQVRYQLNRRR